MKRFTKEEISAYKRKDAGALSYLEGVLKKETERFIETNTNLKAHERDFIRGCIFQATWLIIRSRDTSLILQAFNQGNVYEELMELYYQFYQLKMVKRSESEQFELIETLKEKTPFIEALTERLDEIEVDQAFHKASVQDILEYVTGVYKKNNRSEKERWFQLDEQGRLIFCRMNGILNNYINDDLRFIYKLKENPSELPPSHKVRIDGIIEKIKGYWFSKNRISEDVEDAVQHVWLKLLEDINSGEFRLKSGIYTLFNRGVQAYLNSKGNYKTEEIIDEDGERRIDNPYYSRLVMLRMVKPKIYEVLEMNKVGGLTYKEIALIKDPGLGSVEEIKAETNKLKDSIYYFKKSVLGKKILGK